MTAQVLPMHTAHAPDFGGHSDHHMSLQPGSAAAMEAQAAAAGTATPEDQRGRRRTRENEDDDDDMSVEGATGSSKKRRRSRKGLDKKFECPHEGCGKSYSRAEHLYRHQLNRKLNHFIWPKSLFANCTSSCTG